MKVPNSPLRIKNTIPFFNVVLCDAIPTQINVRDHLFPFEGAQSDPHLLWGLYGTSSINNGYFLAEDYARTRKKLVLTVGIWYHIPSFQLSRPRLTKEIAKELGFFHLGRICTAFQDELLAEAQAWAAQHLDPFALSMTEGMNLHDFVKRHPSFIRHLLSDDRGYDMIIHPVQQSYDLSNQSILWCATCRALPEKIKKAEVRFMPEITVTY